MTARPKIRRRRTGHTGIGRLQVFNEEIKRWENKKKGTQYCAQKVQWVDGRKKQVEKNFETLREAQNFRQFGSERLSIAGKGILMGELFDRFFERQAVRVRKTSLDSDVSRRKHLESLFEIPVTEFSSQHLDAWLVQQKRPENLAFHHSTRTSFERELRLLNKVFTFARDHLELIAKIPILPRHREDSIIDPVRHRMKADRNNQKFLTETQIESLLATCSNLGGISQEAQALSRLLEFQLETGTRIGEAAAIQWEAIDFSGDSAKVEIASTVEWLKGKSKDIKILPCTKTYEKRTVPLRKSFALKLKEWRLLSGERKGLIFADAKGLPFSYRRIQHFFDKAFKKAGLPCRGTHILRHSFATRFLAQTQNQVALKAILGHKHLSQTDHYAKVLAEVPTLAMAQFDAKLLSQRGAANG